MNSDRLFGALRYQDLFDAVQDILYVRDMDGILIDINDAGARFFGRAKHELIGRTLHRDDDDEPGKALRLTNQKLIAHGVDRSTFELRNGAGDLRTVETTTTLIRDAEGNTAGAYGVMRDVSEAVALQRSLAVAMSLLEADNTRKTTELEEARLVHLSLLPTQLPELPDIDVAVHMRSATEVGGDYYDYALTDDGGLALAVGDATGHGLKAGFLGATAKSYFQTMSGRSSVREIIEAMSVAFRNLRLPSLYMCLVLMRIHQGTLSVVGAGMPPIFLRRHATGAVERVEVHGTPLGFHGPFSCDERVLPFEPGDALLVASDGLSDLFNDEDEELGYERIERCLAAADGTAESILGEVLAMVDAWLGGRPLTDDVTVMTIKAR